MVGRPKKYNRACAVYIYADADVLNALDKLGLERSDICNRAMLEAVKSHNSTESELVKEIEELKEQQKVLTCDIASKEAGLKSFRERLVLEGEKEKELLKKQEYVKNHCKDCDMLLREGSENGYCKTCKWEHASKGKEKAKASS